MSTPMSRRDFIAQKSGMFTFESRIDELLSDASAASLGNEGLFRVNRDVIYAPEFKMIMNSRRSISKKYASTCDICNSCDLCNACLTCLACDSCNACMARLTCTVCNACAGCDSCLVCINSNAHNVGNGMDDVGGGTPVCLVMQI